MMIKGIVMTVDTYKLHTVDILIDLGCMRSCVNQEFVQKHKINT